MPELASSHEYAKEAKAEQKAEWVNVGEPPVLGLLEKGKPERKKKCEDVKIKDPDHGLFMVADGVSTTSGDFASRELGKRVGSELGEELDQEIRTIENNRSLDTQRKIELIHALIKSQMSTVLQNANQGIFNRAELDPRMGQAATTASLVKLIEMPDNKQRAYFANAGDSRIFLLRGGNLLRLSVDDSMLAMAVQEGTVTKEQAKRIDQATSIEDLSDEERHYFRFRNMITRSVGGARDENFDVRYIDVRQGDRLFIASDGVTDQLKESQILELLAGQPDDRSAERAVQQVAEKMSLDGTEPRSKADDISGLVRTIGECGHNRKPEQAELSAVSPREISPVDVMAWRANIPRLEQRLADAKQRGENTVDLERELAQHEFWVARMDLKELEENVPARFVKGDQVQFMRQDVQPPVRDRENWIVSDYNAQLGQYIVSHPSGYKHQMIDRFQLEMWQSTNMVRPGDKINLDKKSYSVVSAEKGEVVLVRSVPEGVERRIENRTLAEEALRETLRLGRLRTKQMQSAREKLDPVRSRQPSL